MTGNHPERRRAQRVNANLNLEVKLPRPDGSQDTASLETINISSSGVNFRSDHFIEPMTRLTMELEVGVAPSAGDDQPQTAPVPCEGIVVRTKPEAETEGLTDYEVAVFFTRIEPDGMANLERHIKMLMEDAS